MDGKIKPFFKIDLSRICFPFSFPVDVYKNIIAQSESENKYGLKPNISKEYAYKAYYIG